jgi:hypothetical protein
MKRSCSLLAAIIGIGIGVAIAVAIGFFRMAGPVAIPKVLALYRYFQSRTQWIFVVIVL